MEFFANLAKKHNPGRQIQREKHSLLLCSDVNKAVQSHVVPLCSTEASVFLHTFFPSPSQRGTERRTLATEAADTELPVALGCSGVAVTEAFNLPSVCGSLVDVHLQHSLEPLAKKQPRAAVGAFWKAAFTHCSPG